MEIRPARPSDTPALLDVERAAFGGDTEAALVEALLDDPSAAPLVNLVAEVDGEMVGHILLTHCVVTTDRGGFDASIVAPLAVAPSAQGRGVGGGLCRAGISAVREAGVGLVFLAGHPRYYPRFGFVPAQPLGLQAPYPVDPPEAWMVLETVSGTLGTATGTVRCADALMRPELWTE